MNKPLLAAWLLASGCLTVTSLLAPSAAWAAGAKTSEAQKQYQQDRAKCMRGDTNQDRATCLKEAAAALQESKKLGTGGDSALTRNRLQRCEALPAADRNECVNRMDAGTTSGSAQQGGILRELSSPTK